MIGCLYEVVLHLVTHGELVNRGILHGPWLPIYGTGCIIMVGFGFAGCLFVYGLLSVLKKIYGRIPDKVKKRIALVLLVVFLVDVLVSLICPNMGVGITQIAA